MDPRPAGESSASKTSRSSSTTSCCRTRKRSRVEMTAPKRLARVDEGRPDRRATRPRSAPTSGLPYHAYSASGDVTAPVVYAGSGNPADYDWLAAQGIDIKGKIALVRYSVPYSYRGFKALTAQQRGAAGILIYSDPADDGFSKGKMYPEGPWGPESHIQRGGIVFDFMVPGDPLTPGWASVPGARRIAGDEAVVAAARSSARRCRRRTRRSSSKRSADPRRRRHGRAALPITVSRRRRRSDASACACAIGRRVRPIWTVTGTIRGAHGSPTRGHRRQPSRRVGVRRRRSVERIGGVMELARTLGALARERLPPEADDRVCELGRRRVHADLLDGVGRAVREGAAATRGRVPQRGQRGVRARTSPPRRCRR